MSSVQAQVQASEHLLLQVLATRHGSWSTDLCKLMVSVCMVRLLPWIRLPGTLHARCAHKSQASLCHSNACQHQCMPAAELLWTASWKASFAHGLQEWLLVLCRLLMQVRMAAVAGQHWHRQGVRQQHVWHERQQGSMGAESPRPLSCAQPCSVHS